MISIILFILQALLSVMIVSWMFVLTVAAFRYARSSAAERVLIADAPAGENVIPFRSTRLSYKGSKLSAQAFINPSKGGNA